MSKKDKLDKKINEQYSELIKSAIRIMETAYVPYSKFHVGASILDNNETIHSGSNVENAAYPVGCCAEASAISIMIASGGTKIKAIAVAGDGELLCTPCGGCRQRIREFANLDTPILVCGKEGLRKKFTLSELLPASFGPENLN